MTASIRLGDELRTGKLRLLIEDDLSLRSIMIGEARALDAISFAVRDPDWNTATTVLESLAGTTSDDGFEVVFRCRQSAPGVDVAWSGIYRGAGGVLTAEIDGRSAVDQALNRAGFSVLHPLELRGCSVVVTTEHGAEKGRFSENINPAVLFTDIRAMECDLGPAAVRIEFEGETFETEDHRNWSDAGWKTYCTPLTLPAPRHYGEGARIRQTVRLTPLVSRLESVPGVSQRARNVPPRVTISLGSSSGLTLPQIGSSASDLQEASADSLKHEADLGLAFLDVELVDGQAATDRLARAADEAAALDVPLRVALATQASDVGRWADALERAAVRIESVSVYDADTNSSSSRLLDAMRGALSRRGGAVENAAVGGGTRGYFAELNRLGDPLRSADFLQFSLSPQVHHRDNELVLDTVRAMPDIVHDAERLAGSRPLRVGPITLRQRLNVHRRPAAPLPRAEQPGDDVDWRQHSAFTAVWLLGAIAGLAGAESVSLFRTRGLRGLMPESPDEGSRDELRPFLLLRSLTACLGADLLEIRVDAPRQVVALAVTDADRSRRLWVGNRTPGEVQCDVPAAGVTGLRLGPFDVADLSLHPDPNGPFAGMLQNGIPVNIKKDGSQWDPSP